MRPWTGPRTPEGPLEGHAESGGEALGCGIWNGIWDGDDIYFAVVVPSYKHLLSLALCRKAEMAE